MDFNGIELIFDEEEMKIKAIDNLGNKTVVCNLSPKMNFAKGMRTQMAYGHLIVDSIRMLSALQKAYSLLHKLGIRESTHEGGKVYSEIINLIKKHD
jgi:hypothetical protein